MCLEHAAQAANRRHTLHQPCASRGDLSRQPLSWRARTLSQARTRRPSRELRGPFGLEVPKSLCATWPRVSQVRAGSHTHLSPTAGRVMSITKPALSSGPDSLHRSTAHSPSLSLHSPTDGGRLECVWCRNRPSASGIGQRDEPSIDTDCLRACRSRAMFNDPLHLSRRVRVREQTKPAASPLRSMAHSASLSLHSPTDGGRLECVWCRNRPSASGIERRNGPSIVTDLPNRRLFSCPQVLSRSSSSLSTLKAEQSSQVFFERRHTQSPSLYDQERVEGLSRRFSASQHTGSGSRGVPSIEKDPYELVQTLANLAAHSLECAQNPLRSTAL
jgi:pyruvate-formate lyase-activating enzyme